MQFLKASFLRHGAGVSMLMFLLCASVWGQNISSSLKGTLIDRTGASIPRALCTLTNQATNAQFTATSAADGSFTFPNVLAGKRVPLGNEVRFLQFRTELYNAWNHTQFSGIDAGLKFDPTGKNTNANTGTYNAARSPRIIQLSLKLFF